MCKTTRSLRRLNIVTRAAVLINVSLGDYDSRSRYRLQILNRQVFGELPACIVPAELINFLHAVAYVGYSLAYRLHIYFLVCY